MMKKGVNNYFKVPVVNSSDHDIILNKNMIMGRVESVKSFVLLKLNYINTVSRYHQSKPLRKILKKYK